MGKLHKRTHLGVRRVSKRIEAKPVTARPPAQGKPFVAPVRESSGSSSFKQSEGSFRTYTPPDEEE